MKRRDMLVFTAAAMCGLWALPWGRVAAAETPRGATYYVDPAAGDDANDGLTPARPLRTYAAREFVGGRHGALQTRQRHPRRAARP